VELLGGIEPPTEVVPVVRTVRRQN